MSTNMPEPPRAGEPLRADWGRRLVAAVRACHVVAGPGLLGRETPNGVVLSLARPAVPRGVMKVESTGALCLCRVTSVPQETGSPYVYGVSAYLDGLSAAPTNARMFVTAAADLGSLDIGAWVLGIIGPVSAFAALPGEEDEEEQ